MSLAIGLSPWWSAIRSTVFPGTCESVVIPCLRRQSRRVRGFQSRVSARRLRGERFHRALADCNWRARCGSEKNGRRSLRGLDAEPCLVSLGTAEMIKFACNAFHALKISFANEIGTLAQSLGIPADEVMQTLCRDEKLNVSPAYLSPGFAFGGSCLPKDLRALVYRAARNDLQLPLLESVLPQQSAAPGPRRAKHPGSALRPHRRLWSLLQGEY